MSDKLASGVGYVLLGCLLSGWFAGELEADDWARFRGPSGSGLSAEGKALPTKWGDKENLKWKAPLPGPGASSPIVVGDRVFVTCWSGYGTGADQDQKMLKRHLVCIDRASGQTVWDKTVDAVLPEDEYRGMFMENGYATHTPASDGQRVFAFFGKSGVVAFDMDGKQLWQKSVGTDLDRRGWGSSSSPILYKNLVIVTASVEDRALVGLDKTTGKQVWRQSADGFGSTWGTPILVDLPDGGQELVLGVPYEVWGFHPDTGKLKWYCEGPPSNSMCSSVVAHKGIVYAIESGPGGGGAVAIKAGGKGDVTDSHTVWSTRDRSRIATPVVDDDHLYWVSSKIANCIDRKTGERVYQKRLSATQSASGGGDVERERPQGGRGGRGSGFGGRGGGFGSRGGRGGQDYSSPVAGDGKIFYTTRSGDMYVFKMGGKFEELAKNRFSDGGDYMSTPAISNGQLFIRSSKYLYCVGK